MRKIVAALVAVAVGAVGMSAASTPSTPAPAAKDAPSTPKLTVTQELDQIVARINQKLKAGNKNGAALAEDMKAFDELLAKHKGERTEELAQVQYTKAMLYVQVLRNFVEGAKQLTRLKQEFPNSSQAMRVDDMLAELKPYVDANSIQNTLKPGSKLPDFEEKDLNGNPISIANYKGRPLLLIFWSTNSTPSVAELPGLMKVYQKFHPKGFEIVGVALEEHEFTLKNFLKSAEIPWPQLFDGRRWDNRLALKYGVTAMPTSYFLDGSGKIIAVNLPASALEAALAGMLK